MAAHEPNPSRNLGKKRVSANGRGATGTGVLQSIRGGRTFGGREAGRGCLADRLGQMERRYGKQRKNPSQGKKTADVHIRGGRPLLLAVDGFQAVNI